MNEDFFTNLYIDYYRKIYNLISHRALLNCHADADDLVQDVFLLAYSKREMLATHPNPDGWIMNAAKYACMAYNRGKDVRVEIADIDEMYDLSDGEDFEQTMVERLREEQLIKSDAARKALEALNETDFQIFCLKYIKHLTSKEISHITGMSVSSINVRVFRIKDKVRDFINNDRFAAAINS